MPIYYGLVDVRHVRDYAWSVCDLLGHSTSGFAVELLLETCAQETHLGTYRDAHPFSAGVGLYQFDPPGHKDVVTRASLNDVRAVEREYGFDLRQVQYTDLAFNPLFSTVFARIFYKLRPGAIPETREGRAAYWKRHYNTAAGKGTEREYLRNAERLL